MANGSKSTLTFVLLLALVVLVGASSLRKKAELRRNSSNPYHAEMKTGTPYNVWN